jgi:hypothetical protein
LSPANVRFSGSRALDAEAAVAEIAAGISATPESTTFVFCSPSYDLEVLSKALVARIPGRVLGCTSSGQFGPGGFQLGGMTALSFQDPRIKITPFLMKPLADCRQRAAEVAQQVQNLKTLGPSAHLFGFLLVDGLSRMEERVTSAFYQALGNVPLIGGSAGDDLAFQETRLFWDGEFVTDAAVLSIFETTLPFKTFRFQHFAPSMKRLVVTSATPDQRTIQEFDGLPAVEAYAEKVGCAVADLNGRVFSRNPLMLRIGDDYFVRSIQKANSDGSLSLFCAIEEGLVLSIGFPVDSLGTMLEAFDDASRAVGPTSVILGCDCILRRLQFEDEGVRDVIGKFMADNQVCGFSTYGEQYNGVHVNQTFTGIALGGGT